MKHWIAVITLGIIALATPSQAVIHSGSDVTGHDSAPADNPGWNRIGRIGNGSGIYMGNGWVLTANHVSSKTSFTVDGDTTYNILAGSENTYRLRNTSDTADIDLYMFRVGVSSGDGLYGLADMPIISSIPAVDTGGTHIGTGDKRLPNEEEEEEEPSETKEPEETEWWIDTGPDPDYWQESSFPGHTLTRLGYKSGTRDTLWDYQDISDDDHDFNDMQGFKTDFEDRDDFGTASEHDSGSPFFIKDTETETWYVAGIAHSITSYNGQPTPLLTSVYGNEAIYSDLSAYSGQITSTMAVPEPATLSLLACGAVAILKRRRKRYTSNQLVATSY
jgi:hypothetical protein